MARPDPSASLTEKPQEEMQGHPAANWVPFPFTVPAMSEHKIQNEGRNALAGHCLNFRVNVGQAWTGDAHKLPNGDVLLKNARPFSTGLPAGFADTFGLTPVVVTQDMVGKTIGVFHAIEYKGPGGRIAPKQQAFLQAVRANGGRAGVARSAQEAMNIALNGAV